MAFDGVLAFQGKDHITASQLGRIVEGVAGGGRYVLPTLDEMAATMQTANKVRIAAGDLVMDGRVVTNEAAVDLTVESGTSGYKRNDLVVCSYAKDASTGVETFEAKVVKGTPTTGTAADPAVDEGDISSGSSSAAMPLWRIPIDGITPGTPVRIAPVTSSLSDLRDSVSRAEASIAALNAVSYGTASNTDQVDSGTGVTWVKVGRAVTFRFWVKFKYHQSSYDITPALATGMPRPTGDTDHCGVGLIDGKDGCVLAKVTASGEFKVTRRSATVDANGIVCGFGTYLSAS